jgi:hypothetical protein
MNHIARTVERLFALISNIKTLLPEINQSLTDEFSLN